MSGSNTFKRNCPKCMHYKSTKEGPECSLCSVLVKHLIIHGNGAPPCVSFEERKTKVVKQRKSLSKILQSEPVVPPLNLVRTYGQINRWMGALKFFCDGNDNIITADDPLYGIVEEMEAKGEELIKLIGDK